MQNTQFKTNKLFFILAPAINKKIMEAEISFLKFWGIKLYNGIFFNSYNI